MNLRKLKKMMELHLRFLHLFGEEQKSFFFRKNTTKDKKISKCKKKISFFKNTIK